LSPRRWPPHQENAKMLPKTHPTGTKGRRSAWLATICLFLASLALPATAEDYPSRSIRMIVPTGTATASDMVARLLAQHMGKSLGQSIVVENMPATGGVLGTQQLVR